MAVMSFKASRRADADVATAWAVVTDPDRAGDWLSLARDVSAEGPPGVGRRIHVRTSLLGRPATLELTVDTWDEPHRYRLSARGTFRGALDIRLQEDGRGATQLDATLELHLSRLIPVGRRALGRSVGHRLQEDADRLVKVIEREATRDG